MTKKWAIRRSVRIAIVGAVPPASRRRWHRLPSSDSWTVAPCTDHTTVSCVATCGALAVFVVSRGWSPRCTSRIATAAMTSIAATGSRGLHRLIFPPPTNRQVVV